MGHDTRWCMFTQPLPPNHPVFVICPSLMNFFVHVLGVCVCFCAVVFVTVVRLQPNEKFHSDHCGHDDIWPCPGGKQGTAGELKLQGQGIATVVEPSLAVSLNGVLPLAGSDKTAMVDWTAARLCDGCSCVVPQGVMGHVESGGTGNPTHLSSVGAPPPLTDHVRDDCRKWKSQYKVQMGRSWGELPEPLQKQWKTVDCDRAFGS